MASKETPPLHLPSLSIKGFRGIKDLSISRLGRVTLLAGKNGIGKTTVLDAVRVYATQAHPYTLSQVLEKHREVAVLSNGNVAPRLEAIFYGRDASQEALFSIGPDKDSERLIIEAIIPRRGSTGPNLPGVMSDEDASIFVGTPSYPDHLFKAKPRVLKRVFRDEKNIIPWFFSPYVLSTKMAKSRHIEQWSPGAFAESENYGPPTVTACEAIGPGLLNNEEIVKFWDRIELTDDEPRVLDAVQFMLDQQVERIGIRGDTTTGQRMLVKIRGQSFPVPLESFGDGTLRLFGVALALINSKDGFLLIDEAENGIHHSVQSDFWRILLETAHKNNVQVLATTHSYDCIRGFAHAMTEYEGIEGALIRLERENGHLRAIEYSERNIKAIAKQQIDIEVR